MPGAARLGDKAQVDSDAHGCPGCPHAAEGPVVTGSPDVTIDGKPAARRDDLGIHAACCGPNNFQIAAGSPTVYVNGKPLARMQDKTNHCGGSGPLFEGSPDVLIDDGAAAGNSLGSFVQRALQILSQTASAFAAGTARVLSDRHSGGDLSIEPVAPGAASGAPGAQGGAGPASSAPGSTAAPATQPAVARVDVQVLDAAGNPVPGLFYELTLPDG